MRVRGWRWWVWLVLLGVAGFPFAVLPQTRQATKQLFGNQSANQCLCGPTTGGAATPAFRALVSGDLSTSSPAPVFHASTTTVIVGGATMYIAPGGMFDTVEAGGMAPMPAATHVNLRCYATAPPGASQTWTITGGSGTCGATLTYTSTFTCTITNSSSQVCSDTATTTTATAAGQCMALKVVATSGAANAAVSCAWERT